MDPGRFRHVLGHFPTGVVVVTAMHEESGPVGMAVGSFTSVSLDPPLVAFLPDRGSTSFPKIRAAGSFCINVLADDQEHVCRTFAARGGNKYGQAAWQPQLRHGHVHDPAALLVPRSRMPAVHNVASTMCRRCWENETVGMASRCRALRRARLPVRARPLAARAAPAVPVPRLDPRSRGGDLLRDPSTPRADSCRLRLARRTISRDL